MRMWGVNPAIMCTQHLLGEHVEMHMFAGSINKGISIDGYVKNGLVDTCLIQARHEPLACEMMKRGLNHKSPMDYRDKLDLQSVDMRKSKADLLMRCTECNKQEMLFAEQAKISPTLITLEKIRSVDPSVTVPEMQTYIQVRRHKNCPNFANNHLPLSEMDTFYKIQKLLTDLSLSSNPYISTFDQRAYI